MKIDDLAEKLKDCFRNAEKDEREGKKHKGLLIVKPNDKFAKEYIQKAKDSLDWCNVYKLKGADYKIPEEWFYTLYYCALAFLAKLGVESRSQRYTAMFLEYIALKGVISYEKGFIESLTVYKEKGKESEVDRREEARYSSSIKMEKVAQRYDEMMQFCKNVVSQTEEIIFSDEKYEVPKELL